MSEPTTDPSASSPFPSTPIAPSSRGGGGCGKPLLIGCGVLVVLFGLAAVYIALNINEIVAWTFERMEEQIVANLPDEVTPEERDRLVQAFSAAREKLRQGEVDPAALQEAQTRLMQVIQQSDEGLSRDDILALTEALEKVAGIEPGGEAEAAEPAPES